MIALALCAALAGQQPGALVLCGESFELSEALARELAGSAPHLVLDLDAPAADPLARSASPAVRADLSGEWSSAREAALLPDLARTGALVVNASSWIACWRHFQFEQKDSRLEQELRSAWRAGRPLVATGAAAAYCAGWSIATREEIQRAARNPRRAEPELVVGGLGLAREWMVDTALQAPAGAERLLRQMQRLGNQRALFLSGPVAWIVRGDEAQVAGSGLAAVFDLSRARRVREELREGRLLILRSGDRLRFEKELELQPGSPPANEPAWKPLGLPFEPMRTPGAGLEYHFDWLVQR